MRIVLLALAVATTLGVSSDAVTAEEKDCGDHVCTTTEGHKLVENRKNGELIDCRIEHFARAIDVPYGFIFVASASEGTILPFMRIVIRGVHITPVGQPNELLRLRSVRIVAPEPDFNTKDWQAQVRDGAVWLRSDVLPEARSPIAALAAIGTDKGYAMRVETESGREMLVGVVQLRPTGDIAQRFLACTEELRKAVGG